ncbi:MAG: M14 family zinc carboxypeptidase, partial [Candidatus Aminicenantes bacterium]|nr:M14 family zinc carboxypeptidase [Candidatus Aminicenantes bacterium]
MINQRRWRVNFIWLLTLSFLFISMTKASLAFELNFNRNHLYEEVASYLKWVAKTYPHLTKLHLIGKSYLGKDLLVLEITNQKNGRAIEKPGFWIDGNLHSSEVMGAEVCLKMIETMITQYGKDPFITHIVDTRTTYIMP